MTSPFDRIEALGYPVDYTWAAAHGRLQDFCLLGRLRGDDVVEAAEAVQGLLRGREQYDGYVDGEPFVAAVDGGLRARAVPAEGGIDVELYSTGEDAADVIAQFSDLVAHVVTSVPGQGWLIWEPLDPIRPDRHFSFDAP